MKGSLPILLKCHFLKVRVNALNFHHSRRKKPSEMSRFHFSCHAFDISRISLMPFSVISHSLVFFFLILHNQHWCGPLFSLDSLFSFIPNFCTPVTDLEKLDLWWAFSVTASTAGLVSKDGVLLPSNGKRSNCSWEKKLCMWRWNFLKDFWYSP